MADSVNERLITAGDVVLEKLELETVTGDLYNILDIMTEVNIYEDLLGNAVSGSVFITDSTNLINTAQVIGQEVLRIKFKTPAVDPDPIRELKFHVYKISERVVKNDRTQGYMLYFTTIPTIRNSLTKISKSFQGQISNMAIEIAQDFLEVDIEDIEATVGDYTFVIPYWTPYKTLNWLAKRASTVQNAQDRNYVFYESINKYSDTVNDTGMSHNFVSIGDLMSREPRHKNTYYFGFVQRTQQETNKELYENLQATFYSVNDFEILAGMDTLSAIDGGMFASRIVSYDIRTKEIKRKDFNYIEDFHKRRGLLGKSEDAEKRNPLTVDRENAAGFKFHDFYDSNIVRYDTHSLSTANGLDHDPTTYMLERQSAFQQLGMQTLRCKVPGNSYLRVGDVFEVILPSMESQASEGVEDKFLSGKYLVTKLRHQIQKGEYFCTLEMVKDSMYEPIVESQEITK